MASPLCSYLISSTLIGKPTGQAFGHFFADTLTQAAKYRRLELMLCLINIMKFLSKVQLEQGALKPLRDPLEG